MDTVLIDEEIMNGDYDGFDNFAEIVAIYKAQVEETTK